MPSLRPTLTCAAVALLAGGAGVLIALLYAPVSGRETRRMLARRLDDGKEKLGRSGRRALENVKEYVDEKVDESRAAVAHLVGR